MSEATKAGTAIRAVFFDAVGTLIYPDPPAAAVYAEVGRRHDSRLSAAALGERFRAAFLREEAFDQANGLRTSEERELRRWRNIVAEVLDDVGNGAACFEELYHHFSLPAAWRCEEDAAEVLEVLAGRGYVLGMASNYDHRLRSVVEGRPELRPLTHLVISSEVGWRKPAPEFFAAAAARVGLPARQVLYVGDDRLNDLEGGRAAGSPVVFFDPRGKAVDVGGRITRLTEVLALLP